MAKKSKSIPTLQDRSSGVLLHISSLPGPYYTGDLGESAYQFVDYLADCKQSWWQMLPINPLGDGNSPYSTVSSNACEPLFIDIEDLVKQKLLKKSDVETPSDGEGKSAKYGSARKFRMPLLKKAFEQATQKEELFKSSAFRSFRSKNKYWLEDFCLFMALCDHHKTPVWSQWPVAIRNYQQQAIQKAKLELEEQIKFYEFLQYQFHQQWLRLKAYANERGVALLGDIPIYVSLNSADVWSNQSLFMLDKNKKPTFVTGVPPDRFNKDGQLWGNAFYRWSVMKKNGFKWWINRVKRQLDLFDAIRLDHFIGFHRCWQIPADAETARTGKFVPGPRAVFFETLAKEFGQLPLIAEDLGLVIPQVEQLRDEFALPGMKVLQFAFGGEDQDPGHKPYRIPENAVVYTGTHDNDTTKGWYKDLAARAEKDKQAQLEYSNVNRYISTSAKMVHKDLIRLAMMSPAAVAIFPAQDLIGLPTTARMNIPGTAKGNWKWRLKEKALSETTQYLKDFTEIYGRALNK